jgi:Zn-dependent protease
MDLTYIAIILVVTLFSMTLHEAMHAFVGYWLGDDTARLQGRLTLNPIAHIDPFMTVLLPVILAITGAPIFGGAKPVPFNPDRVRYGEFGAALVGVAGPLTNFVLAFIAFGLLVITGAEGLFGTFLRAAVYVNLGFFVFNMLPIPPLDGSRVLYAFAPDFARRGMETIEQYGLIVIFALVLLMGSLIGSFMAAVTGFILEVFGAIFGVK